MISLYEMAQQYEDMKAIAETFEDDTGIMQEALDNIQDKIDTKAENIAKFIKSLEAERDCFKAERERLEKKERSINNKINWLKNYLLAELQKLNISKVKGKILSLVIKKNPVSVLVKDEKIIPENYFIINTTRQVSKTAIKEAIENGQVVPGAELTQTISLKIS